MGVKGLPKKKDVAYRYTVPLAAGKNHGNDADCVGDVSLNFYKENKKHTSPES